MTQIRTLILVAAAGATMSACSSGLSDDARIQKGLNLAEEQCASRESASDRDACRDEIGEGSARGDSSARNCGLALAFCTEAASTRRNAEEAIEICVDAYRSCLRAVSLDGGGSDGGMQDGSQDGGVSDGGVGDGGSYLREGERCVSDEDPRTGSACPDGAFCGESGLCERRTEDGRLETVRDLEGNAFRCMDVQIFSGICAPGLICGRQGVCEREGGDGDAGVGGDGGSDGGVGGGDGCRPARYESDVCPRGSACRDGRICVMVDGDNAGEPVFDGEGGFLFCESRLVAADTCPTGAHCEVQRNSCQPDSDVIRCRPDYSDADACPMGFACSDEGLCVSRPR